MTSKLTKSTHTRALPTMFPFETEETDRIFKKVLRLIDNSGDAICTRPELKDPKNVVFESSSAPRNDANHSQNEYDVVAESVRLIWKKVPDAVTYRINIHNRISGLLFYADCVSVTTNTCEISRERLFSTWNKVSIFIEAVDESGATMKAKMPLLSMGGVTRASVMA